MGANMANLKTVKTRMDEMERLVTEYQQMVVDPESQVFLTKIGGMRRTLMSLKKSDVEDIEGASKALLKTIGARMLNSFKDKLFSLKARVKVLVDKKQDSLAHVERFNNIDDIHKMLDQIKLPQRGKVVNLDYKALERIKGMVERNEMLASQMEVMIKLRSESHEVKFIRNMIKTTRAVLTDIRAKDTNDARLPILEAVIQGLQHKLDEYLNLTIANKSDFIVGSIQTIHECLSSEHLNSLADQDADYLIAYFRSVLKPINWLIKESKGEIYQPHFFTKSAKIGIVNAAQTAHDELISAFSAAVKDRKDGAGAEPVDSKPR